MRSIEDVIKSCTEQYGLNVTEGSKQKYRAFLERQLQKHPEYNLDDKPKKGAGLGTCFTLLVDKLLIFSYLIRESQTKLGPFQDTVINKDEKLALLRVRGRDGSLWNDKRLHSVYIRRDYHYKTHKTQRYVAIIDELGEDSEVVKLWKRKISYQKDISGRGAFRQTCK